MTWSEYVQKIQNEHPDKIKGRMDVIREAKILFERGKPFCEFSDEERKFVAGLPSQHVPNSGHFGSMKGSGIFMKRINENDQHISDALDAIPLQGDVTHEDYRYFVNIFEAAEFDRNMMAPATRLLAMKHGRSDECVVRFVDRHRRYDL